jgi:N,N-dimethylformamidase beta subunit-like, C-terminal
VRPAWRITDTIRIRRDWPSGYYVALLRLTSGAYAGRGYRVPFIVRQSGHRRAPILVQASVNTWEAYNAWGGKSLYQFNSTQGRPADHVSFDRPFDHTAGNTSPLSHEIQLVRFLERNGYDVGYQTDIDTDRDPGSLLRSSLVIVNGHGEYWTKAERDAIQGARDAGRNLIFAGADMGFWQVRYEGDRHTLVGYKDPGDPYPDPTQRTIQARKLGRPECQIVGVQYAAESPAQLPNGGRYTVVADPRTSPWMAGTGLRLGESFPGLVGYEWDTEAPGCDPPGLQRIFYAPGARPATFVVYRSAAGAWVQSWGSMYFKYAIDDFGAPPAVHAQPALQAYERNTIDALAGVGASERTVALGLPPAHGCRAGRRLRVALRAPAAVRLRSAVVRVGTNRFRARRRGGRMLVTVALDRIHGRRFTVIARAVTRDGHHLRDQRRYRRC